MRAVAIQSERHAQRRRARACGEVTSRGEDIVATVHGDDITIGGERIAVEFLVRMISKKYEIKKKVIGEDPDLEKTCH